MDLQTILGYFSGLYLIRTDIETSTFVPTLSLIHTLDAILCRLVAANSGRNRDLWTVAGLVLGIWALAALFLLPGKSKDKEGPG